MLHSCQARPTPGGERYITAGISFVVIVVIVGFLSIRLIDFRICYLILGVVVAKVVDVVDILLPDQRANPDEMSPGRNAP